MRLLRRKKLRMSENLYISTTLWCHAENMQQVSEGDSQMFVP